MISTSTVIPIEFSDHDLIACVRKLNHQTYKPKTIEFRDYKNYTPNGMCQNISAHGDFNKVIADDDVNTCWNNLKSIISTCLDDIAPKIKKHIHGKPSPWLTLELKTQMNLRGALFRKRRKTKMLEDIQNYKKQKNLVNRMVKRAKKEYVKELLEKSSQDTSSFWNTIKKLYPSNKPSTPRIFNVDGSPTSDNYVITNAFCSYFSNVI